MTFRAWRRAALLLAALTLTNSAPAAPSPAVNTLMMLLRKGQYRMAIQNGSRALERDPDDINVLAAMAIGWSRAGYHSDALGAFALSRGAEVYEALGLEAEAESLGATGRADEAVALREQALLQAGLDETHEVRLLLGMADDYRWAGRPEEAIEAAERALAVWPQSSMVLAVIADAQLDRDDIADADATLGLAMSYGENTRTILVAARRALIADQPEEALIWAEAARDFRSGSVRLIALSAMAQRQAGRLEEARTTLERNKARLTEDPEILSARILVYTDLGELAVAREWAARAAAVYPGNVGVQRALAWLAAHGGR